jgi:hypothetical protein
MLVLAGWLPSNKKHALKVWTLVGFLPFGITAVPHLFIAAISWPMWRGYAKGAEISALDLLLVALYLGMPKAQNNLPFKASFGFYFFAVLISVFQADAPVAALFYVWQVARMFFVYMVIARASEDERVVESILTGMLIGLVYEASLVLWQRFALGDVQTPGTFGHQNTLGLISHFVAFPLCALFLAGKKGWRPLAAPVAGIIVAVLTVSRATIGLAAGGYVLLYFLSAFRKWTTRLARTALVGIVVASAIAPIAIYSYQRRLVERGEAGKISTYDERAAFEQAAEKMLADHPFGVGANNFVVVANTKGYFVLFLLQPLILAWRVGWRHRNNEAGVLLLGFAVALLLVYLQSLFEWTFFLFYSQYMFVLTIGMVAGLSQQFRYRRRRMPSESRSNDNKTNLQPVSSQT